MRFAVRGIVASTIVLLIAYSSDRAGSPRHPNATPEGPPVLWRAPVDIGSRNLYYGAGGRSHLPKTDLTFLSEDTTGASPKFDAVDDEGIHWKVKLGIEARPENTASRLVWAAGYFANEDYFLPEVHVRNLPRLHRGSAYVSDGGIVHDARLKRHSPDEKKVGIWSWARNPFASTREWNGLRVLMALMNIWDLKDINNAVYQTEGDQPEQHYIVSDLGASFGTTYLTRTLKGDLRSYEKSKWILAVTGDRIDFNVPGRPPVTWIVVVPTLIQRLDLVWIGRGIPRADALWLGQLLGRLSPDQIRDAFRASGYSEGEVERFSRVVEQRIAELKRL
jgi:hypothetical protein